MGRNGATTSFSTSIIGSPQRELVPCNNKTFVNKENVVSSCPPQEVTMAPRYRVTLLESERATLEALTRKDKTGAKKFINARVLLLCDAGEGGPAWTVADVAEALGISSRTVEHIKKRFVEDGLEAALERKQRETPPRAIVFDGEFEARLIALACTKAPEGHARWTVRLLADKVVELNLAPSISHMSVQRILKKANLSLTRVNIGKFHRSKTRLL
jgi:transposase